MYTPQQTQQILSDAELFFGNSLAGTLSTLRSGGTACGCCDENRFERALGILRFMVDNNVYNGTSDALTDIIKQYKGNYQGLQLNTLALAQIFNMNVGDVDQLISTTSNSSEPVVLTSSNTLAASIVNGRLHANNAGQTIITATQAGDENYYGGSVTQSVTITQNANFQLAWGYFGSDPSNNLSGLTYQNLQSFTAGSTSVALNFGSAANQKYLVVRLPIATPLFNHYDNGGLDNGPIPSFVFAVGVDANFRYIYSRNLFNLNTVNNTITFSIQ